MLAISPSKALVSRIVSGLLASIVILCPIQNAFSQSALSDEEESAIEENKQRGMDMIDGLIDSDADQIDEDFRKESMKIAEDSRESIRKELKSEFGYNLGEDQSSGSDNEMDSSIPTVIVYVSASLSNSELKDTLTILEGIDSVNGRVIYQGVLEGETLSDFAVRLGNLIPEEGLESTSIEIDPTLFEEGGVETVPRIEYRSPKGDIVASVDGLSNPKWLTDKVSEGETGHLGTRGPIKMIDERNLIEVMKERLKEINFQKEKERTIQSFWDRVELPQIPSADDSEVRRMDPSIVIQKPMKDADGNVIHERGKVINPLEMKPFTRRLLVVDPTREEEIDWILSRPESSLKDIVMITNIDRSKGWDGYTELQNEIGDSLFMLTPEVGKRFLITSTPTQVTAENNQFIIETFDVGEDSDQ